MSKGRSELRRNTGVAEYIIVATVILGRRDLVR